MRCEPNFLVEFPQVVSTPIIRYITGLFALLDIGMWLPFRFDKYEDLQTKVMLTNQQPNYLNSGHECDNTLIMHCQDLAEKQVMKLFQDLLHRMCLHLLFFGRIKVIETSVTPFQLPNALGRLHFFLFSFKRVYSRIIFKR